MRFLGRGLITSTLKNFCTLSVSKDRLIISNREMLIKGKTSRLLKRSPCRQQQTRKRIQVSLMVGENAVDIKISPWNIIFKCSIDGSIKMTWQVFKWTDKLKLHLQSVSQFLDQFWIEPWNEDKKTILCSCFFIHYVNIQFVLTSHQKSLLSDSWSMNFKCKQQQFLFRNMHWKRNNNIKPSKEKCIWYLQLREV